MYFTGAALGLLGMPNAAQIHSILGDLAPSFFRGVALVEVVLCLNIVLVGWWSPVECLGFCACVSLLRWDLLSSGHLIPIRLPQIDLSVSQWGSKACPYSNTRYNYPAPVCESIFSL